MTTVYPGTKQSFTNPIGTNTLDSPDHAGQHSDINDTAEAVQDVIGTTLGTNVLKSFAAGDFPVRNTGGGATGTVVQTLVGGTFANTLVGTSQITGGTFASGVANNLTIGTSAITGGTLASSVGNALTLGSPVITNGTATSTTLNAGVLGSPAVTSGTFTSSVGNAITLGTPAITSGTATSTVLNSNVIGTPAITGGTATNTTLTTPTFSAGAVSNTALANGVVVQVVFSGYTEAAIGTALIPNDDTIPQSTEGVQFMAGTITPKGTANLLVVEAVSFVSPSAASATIGALFRDAGTDSIASTNVFIDTATAVATQALGAQSTSGTTGATVFTYRASPTTGTLTFNGQSGVRKYGATPKSYIKITEIKAT